MNTHEGQDLIYVAIIKIQPKSGPGQITQALYDTKSSYASTDFYSMELIFYWPNELQTSLVGGAN